jgi:hypothetical protein
VWRTFMELSRKMDKPVSILFKIVFMGLFLFMVTFIMKLEISDFDSYSYLGKANHNAGFHYYDEPELNTRPPLYPFLLTPIAALQHLGVSSKAVLKTAQLIALVLSFAFIGASYLLLKSLLSQELAALGSLLMMIQPVFLLFSFEPMVDLPCSLILVLAMRFYLRYRENPCRKNLIWVCFLTGLGMITKYSLVVAPLIFSLAEIVVLRTKEKMRWSSIFKNRFIYLVPLISTGFYMLISLISFAPQYGWTWKNVSMVYAPFFLRINYSTNKEFEFDFLANFSFLEVHMTLPWFILMIFGLYYCLKYMEWQSMVLWSWFVGFMVFITFVSWNYHVQYLFPVMPACYFFSLYGVKSIYGWAQKRIEGKGYFYFFRIVGFVTLIAWPVMNLVGEIQSLRNGIYSNKVSDRIVAKVKELSSKNGAVWYIGQYYPIYQSGQQIHPQDWFYKIYHLGNNALSFLSAQKIRGFPDYTRYEYFNFLKDEDTLIYYPGPGVTSKFLPAPESIPSILVGKIETLAFIFKNQSEKVKSFMTRDGLSQIQLTSIADNHMVIELSVNDNQDSGRIFWFKLDHRIIKPKMVERNFFYFKANEDMVLPASRKYFERIQEITLLSYEAEEFR